MQRLERAIYIDPPRAYQRARVPPTGLDHVNRIIARVVPLHEPRSPDTIPTNLSQLWSSSWHWDRYRDLHLFPYLTRYAFACRTDLKGLTAKVEAGNGISDELKKRLILGNNAKDGYLELGRSGNHTTWFFDYGAQFTHFFRWLQKTVQRKDRSGNRTLLIRDFGCSSGEETHLIAMLVHHVLEDFGRRAGIQKLEKWLSSWDVKIIGYSFCPLALERAEEARFFTSSSEDYHGCAHIISVPHPFELLYRYIRLREGLPSRINSDIADWLRFEWLDLFDLEDLRTLCRQNADAIVCRRTFYLDQLELGTNENGADRQKRQVKASLLYMLDGISSSGFFMTDRTGANGTIETLVTSEGFAPLGDREQREDDVVNSGVYRKSR